MENSQVPVYCRLHWGKSDRSNPERIHLLEHHMADVAACFEAILDQPTMRRRLASSGRLECISPRLADRLSVLAALHDIGKINNGFQCQTWREDTLGGKKRPQKASHTLDLIPFLKSKEASWFFKALRWKDIMQWDTDDGRTTTNLFLASLSHHGIPVPYATNRYSRPRDWQKFGDLDPRDFVERLAKHLRLWFPRAFENGTERLPARPEFQHAFLGLCTLADWLGSNEEFFPFCDEPQETYIDIARWRACRALKDIGLDLTAQRLACAELPAFKDLFDFDAPPNAVQRSLLEVPLDQQLIIVESETGSGKTEAALWRFAKMYQRELVDGLYFALPTRAAASQMHRRIGNFVAKLLPGDLGPEPVLAIPGYLQMGDARGVFLPDFKVLWDDHAQGRSAKKRWSAESAKRFLAAQIAVGTVDQAMMAALRVKHSHMRASCLARNLLILDEVHASDSYMHVILEALLEAHMDAGGYAILMSATLGSSARRRWLFQPGPDASSLDEAMATPYPSLATKAHAPKEIPANRQDKEVRVDARPWMSDFSRVAERALREARSGAKVLVIRNTVRYALETQKAIETLTVNDPGRWTFAFKGIPTLHHGRFAASDRRGLDAEVEAVLGKTRSPGGRVVVGTQTLEQSLDIDADLLITDLCPMDVLLQRIGRLHRHAHLARPSRHQRPICVVLVPADRDLASLIDKPQNGLGMTKDGRGVYANLCIIEATRRLVLQYADASNAWRIPTMNRELVERATHAKALRSLVEECGGKWQEHYNQIRGFEYGDGQSARLYILDRALDFWDQETAFGDNEERIRTRIGDEGIEITLEPPAPSPFTARPIEKLTFPSYMAMGHDGAETIVPVESERGFEFTLGQTAFRYDRLGLRAA